MAGYWLALYSRACDAWPPIRGNKASSQNPGRLAGAGIQLASRQEAAWLGGTGPGGARVYRPRASAARCCTQRRTDG